MALATALVVAGPAAAEPLPADALQRECWLRHTAERTRPQGVDPTAVEIGNLRDGWAVSSPFRVDFAIRGMGVIPAGKPHPKAGHHHVLVDTPLPINPGQQIPFNDFHRHFGKGQTSAELALAPGEHRLRLLFADQDHKPYFVFSPELRLTVRGPRGEPPRIARASFDADCKTWYADEMTRPRSAGPRVRVSNIRDGEALASPFVVRLAADGFGIAPKGFGGEGLGHFMFEVLRPDGSLLKGVDLGNGATQTTLSLPLGNWTLRVRLFDDGGRVERVPAAELRVQVTAQERL